MAKAPVIEKTEAEVEAERRAKVQVEMDAKAKKAEQAQIQITSDTTNPAEAAKAKAQGEKDARAVKSNIMTVDMLVNKTNKENIEESIKKQEAELKNLPEKEKVAVGEVNADDAIIIFSPNHKQNIVVCVPPKLGKKEGKDYNFQFINHHYSTDDVEKIKLLTDVLKNNKQIAFEVVHLGKNLKTGLKKGRNA